MNNFEEQYKNGDEPWQMVVPISFSSSKPADSNILKLWALVLDSRSIPCCIEKTDNCLILTVPPEYTATAVQELEQFYLANIDWPPIIQNLPNIKTSTMATVSILLLLATFHNLVHLENSTVKTVLMPDFMNLGTAQASLILDGQWWRAITALTLHADWIHLSGNLAIGGIFIYFLCREIGTGLAWFSILTSGTIGNMANICIQGRLHSSVGASTAVFGAVGVLAAISMAHNYKNKRKRWQMPIAAALALLGILGTEGKNTDIGAHLFGFMAGIGIGLLIVLVIIRHALPGKILNALFAFAALFIVGVAWWFAIKNG